MLKNILFKNAIILFLTIATLYLVAEFFYLHWTLWWYDVILHLISGGLIGIVVVFLWSDYYNASYNQKLKIISTTLILALVIGVFWEIFELYFDKTSLSHGISYKRDTASDLIADITGAFFG